MLGMRLERESSASCLKIKYTRRDEIKSGAFRGAFSKEKADSLLWGGLDFILLTMCFVLQVFEFPYKGAVLQKLGGYFFLWFVLNAWISFWMGQDLSSGFMSSGSSSLARSNGDPACSR